MGVHDNWLANLRAVLDEYTAAGPKLHKENRRRRDAYKQVAHDTGLSEEYIYQLDQASRGGKRKNMGRDAAEKIARAYANGRPLDWIDRPVASEGQPQLRAVSDSDWAFLQDFKVAPEEERELVRMQYRIRAEAARKLAEEANARHGATRVATDEQVAKSQPGTNQPKGR